MTVEDDVYLESAAEREEYVLSKTGMIFRGTHKSPTGLHWNFAQVGKPSMNSNNLKMLICLVQPVNFLYFINMYKSKLQLYAIFVMVQVTVIMIGFGKVTKLSKFALLSRGKCYFISQVLCLPFGLFTLFVSSQYTEVSDLTMVEAIALEYFQNIIKIKSLNENRKSQRYFP